MKPPINIEYIDSNIFVMLLFIFMGQSERLWQKGRFHQKGFDGNGKEKMIIEKLDGRVILIDEEKTRPILHTTNQDPFLETK